MPDTKSRSALGETADGGLAEIFRREFGEPGSRRYEAARDNFIASEAGCALVVELCPVPDQPFGQHVVIEMKLDASWQKARQL